MQTVRLIQFVLACLGVYVHACVSNTRSHVTREHVCIAGDNVDMQREGGLQV